MEKFSSITISDILSSAHPVQEYLYKFSRVKDHGNQQSVFLKNRHYEVREKEFFPNIYLPADNLSHTPHTYLPEM